MTHRMGSNAKILQCPECDSENLHQGAVKVEMRPREDGPGRIVKVDSMRLSSSEVEPDAFIGRRNGVQIEFTCEWCDEGKQESPVHTLLIWQHKGLTFIEWADGSALDVR